MARPPPGGARRRHGPLIQGSAENLPASAGIRQSGTNRSNAAEPGGRTRQGTALGLGRVTTSHSGGTLKRTILAACALALAGGVLSMGSVRADVPGCTDVTIGQVCASGDPATATGDVYTDGNEGNPGLLAGYIGVNDDEGVVGCASGDYDANHGTAADETENDSNSVITPIPPDPENPPSGEPGPCTPTAP